MYMLLYAYLPIVYTFVYVAHMYRCMRLEVHPQSNGKWGRHHCSINLEGDACERKLLNASLVHKLQPGTGEGPDLKDFTVTINDGKGNHPKITWFRVGEVGEIWFRQIGAWFFSGETGTSTHCCLAGRCGCRSRYSKCPNYICHWNSWVGQTFHDGLWALIWQFWLGNLLEWMRCGWMHQVYTSPDGSMGSHSAPTPGRFWRWTECFEDDEPQSIC